MDIFISVQSRDNKRENVEAGRREKFSTVNTNELLERTCRLLKEPGRRSLG